MSRSAYFGPIYNPHKQLSSGPHVVQIKLTSALPEQSRYTAKSELKLHEAHVSLQSNPPFVDLDFNNVNIRVNPNDATALHGQVQESETGPLGERDSMSIRVTLANHGNL